MIIALISCGLHRTSKCQAPHATTLLSGALSLTPCGARGPKNAEARNGVQPEWFSRGKVVKGVVATHVCPPPNTFTSPLPSTWRIFVTPFGVLFQNGSSCRKSEIPWSFSKFMQMSRFPSETDRLSLLWLEVPNLLKKQANNRVTFDSSEILLDSFCAALCRPTLELVGPDAIRASPQLSCSSPGAREDN